MIPELTCVRQDWVFTLRVPCPQWGQLQTTGTQREVVLLLPTWTVLVWLLGPGLGFQD